MWHGVAGSTPATPFYGLCSSGRSAMCMRFSTEAQHAARPFDSSPLSASLVAMRAEQVLSTSVESRHDRHLRSALRSDSKTTLFPDREARTLPPVRNSGPSVEPSFRLPTNAIWRPAKIYRPCPALQGHPRQLYSLFDELGPPLARTSGLICICSTRRFFCLRRIVDQYQISPACRRFSIALLLPRNHGLLAWIPSPLAAVVVVWLYQRRREAEVDQ